MRNNFCFVKSPWTWHHEYITCELIVAALFKILLINNWARTKKRLFTIARFQSANFLLIFCSFHLIFCYRQVKKACAESISKRAKSNEHFATLIPNLWWSLTKKEFLRRGTNYFDYHSMSIKERWWFSFQNAGEPRRVIKLVKWATVYREKISIFILRAFNIIAQKNKNLKNQIGNWRLKR